jgi:parallel beta-helix repeat protein
LLASTSYALDIHHSTEILGDLFLQPGESVNILGDELVLDCKDHKIVANNSSPLNATEAIRIVGRRAVWVRNCTIFPANDKAGILVKDSTQIGLHLMNIYYGETGVRLSGTHDSWVFHMNFFNQTGNGVHINLGSSRNTVHGVYMLDIGGAGVLIDAPQGGNNTVQWSTFEFVANGVYLWTTGHNTVFCNIIREAEVSGVVLDSTSNNTVRSNAIHFTGDWGVLFVGNPGPETVINNHACHNGHGQTDGYGPPEQINPNSTLTGNTQYPVCGAAIPAECRIP